MADKKPTPKPTPKKGKASKKDNPKKSSGRPSLLTDEVIAKLADAIAIGSSHELAATYAGISYPTFQNWLRLARAAKAKAEAEGEQALDPSEARYLTFLREMDVANGEAGITWQQIVHKQAKMDGNLALRMLALRFSGYSDRPQVTITANIDYTKLTDDQLQRLANGEDPAVVLADSGGGSAGTPTPAGNSPATGK